MKAITKWLLSQQWLWSRQETGNWVVYTHYVLPTTYCVESFFDRGIDWVIDETTKWMN